MTSGCLSPLNPQAPLLHVVVHSERDEEVVSGHGDGNHVEGSESSLVSCVQLHHPRLTAEGGDPDVEGGTVADVGEAREVLRPATEP